MSASFVQGFFDDTGIFGVHFFRHPRSRFYTVFWSIFVAIFAAYTAKTLVGICAKYVGEETSTVVYQKTTDVFGFPDPLICIYAAPVADYLNQARSISIGSALDQFAETGELNVTNFLASVKLIKELQKIELLSVNSSTDRLSMSIASLIDSHPDISALFGKLPNRYSADLATFSDFLLQKLCVSLRMTIMVRNDSLQTSQINVACERQTIFIPRDVRSPEVVSICVALEKSAFVFRSPIDRVTIQFGFSASQLDQEVGLSESQTIIYFVLDGRSHVSGGEEIDYDVLTEILHHARRRFYARLTASYWNLDLRRRRCEPDRSRALACATNCESRFFVDSHDCWPSIYATKSTTVRRCDWHDYLNSTRSPLRSLIDNLAECRRRCFPSCTKATYSTTAEYPVPSETTSAQIHVQSYVYTRIDETLTSDLESFLSDMGGALGLWLGASFGAIVHVVLFVVESVVRFLWRRQNIPTSNNIEEMTSEMVDVGKTELSSLRAKVDSLEKMFLEEREQMTRLFATRFEGMEKAVQ